MIEFERVDQKEALRDFLFTELQRQHKDVNWLIEQSGVSKDTLVDRMLAKDLSNKPTPQRNTINRIFKALNCPFEQFEEYYHQQQINNQSAVSSGDTTIINTGNNNPIFSNTPIHGGVNLTFGNAPEKATEKT